MVVDGFTTLGRILPFSVDEQIWDTLSADIRRVLWDGWSLKLQLDDVSASGNKSSPIGERGVTGLVKPVAPLTPEQSRKRQSKLDAQAALISDARRLAAEKILQLQRRMAAEP